VSDTRGKLVDRLTRLVGVDRRKRFSVQARLTVIEQRLDDIDGRLNHWISLLEQLNHGVADMQQKLGDAATDVEMAAALLMTTERRLAGSPTPPND
jgi:DNA repair ATPase RecN